MSDETSSYSFIIVDDDATDRAHYLRLLRRQSSRLRDIREAANGTQGLAVLRERVPDCVLLDFNLPDMTGLDFLSSIADQNGNLPCAVVLVTGQGNQAIAIEAMKRGAQDYLVKDQINESSLWRATTTAVTQTKLHNRLAISLNELTAANAELEQQIIVRRQTEAELRAAKEAAESASKAKTRFVAMVTHELRTPLNGILGYAQLLRMDGTLSAEQDARVGAMMQAGRHLHDMIEQVLDFSCIEAGRMELHPVPFQVRDLLESCVAFIGPMAVERGLDLRIVASHDAPRQIVADVSRLRQVLLNLLGNAVKYTHAGGVELRLVSSAVGRARIEVADSGPGIDSQVRDRLFCDFERLDTPTAAEGAGLGLAIAARIVELMGGSIGYADNPIGGSVFWLDVPIGDVGSASIAVSSSLGMTVPVSSGQRILLVDDVAMNRDVIGAFLRAAGHDVVLAENGPDAVRFAFEQVFDVILMDVRMAGMDGLEATRRIRALPGLRGRVPIIALTAYAFPDQIAQCRDAGMDGHISKPVDYATLIQGVNNALLRVAPVWADHPGEAALPDCDPEPWPKFDTKIFNELVSLMSPVEAITTFQALRDRGEFMLQLLERSGPAAAVAEQAHTLASTAGMFGFMAQSRVARSLENAIALDHPDIELLIARLRAETRDALQVLHDVLLAHTVKQA